MTGLPTVQVLLDDGTGTFPTNITSKCLLADGYSFTRGRDDWQSAVTAGSLTLRLNNADGRFTPGSTILGTPSPIKVDQRIRITETVNGGTTYNRFTGYVKAWPVEWPAIVPSWSTVTITATDAQARAERRVLRSMVEEEILQDSPQAYYTLGEPEGAVSAADSSGNQAPPLTMTGSGADVVFGSATGPGTDSLTAATFSGGKYLTATLQAAPGMVAFWFSTTATDVGLVDDFSSAGPSAGGLYVNSSGMLTWAGGSTIGSAAVNNGAWHRVTWAAGAVNLDGAAFTPAVPAPSAALQFGINANAANVLTGSIAHISAYVSTLSGARNTAHYQSGTTGFSGESGTARITRIAGYAGIPIGTLDPSLTNVSAAVLAGKTAQEAIQLTVDAEGGLAYFDGAGTLRFLNRDAAPVKTTPDLTLSAQYVIPDAQPVTDDQQILNYIEAIAEGTGLTQVVRSTTSETTHGRYSDSQSYPVTTDAEALSRAAWLIANYAEPTTRFGTLAVNLYAMTTAQQQLAVSKLEPGAWLRVFGTPSQTPGGTTIDVVVQGISAKQSAGEWTITCNVVTRSLFTAWIMGDATYGVMGVTTKLYY